MGKKTHKFEEAIEEIDDDIATHISAMRKLDHLNQEMPPSPMLKVLTRDQRNESNEGLDSTNTRTGLPRPKLGTRISPETGVTISVKVGICYKERLDKLSLKRRSTQLYPFLKRDLVEIALDELFLKFEA